MKLIAPSLPPSGITIMATSARSLKVWWKKPIVSSGYEPIIKGYYVGYRIHASGKSFVFKTVDASLQTDREEYEGQEDDEYYGAHVRQVLEHLFS